MEQQTISKLVKQYVKAVYCHPAYLTYAKYIMWNARLDEAQAGIKIAGRNINNFDNNNINNNISNNIRYTHEITLMAENEEELRSLLMKLKEESEKIGLKLSIQKT